MLRNYWAPSAFVMFFVLLAYLYHQTRFGEAAGERGVSMPAKVVADEERALYLTPGGLYTQDDIVANGSTIASQKFRGFRAQHDFHPQRGDRLCPITRTKANPQCAWVIGGKSYEFCCPPCVDEFLRLAKEQPLQVLPHDDYLQP